MATLLASILTPPWGPQHAPRTVLRCTRLIVGVLGLTLLTAGTAQAQNWEGPYAGLHLGYRWGNLDLTSPAYSFPDGFGGMVQVPARNESYSLNAPIFGGHAGYNFLLSEDWLVSIEGDIAAAGGASKSSSTGFSSMSAAPCIDLESIDVAYYDKYECGAITTNSDRISRVELGWQATLRARLGFIDGSTLYYAAAGLAWIQADWNETISISGGQSSSVSKSAVLPGWTVGFGSETFIAQDWIARIEYLYEDFSNTNIPLAFTSEMGTIEVIAHKLRLGLSWKF